MNTYMHTLQKEHRTWDYITTILLEESKRFASQRDSESESQLLERTTSNLLQSNEKDISEPKEGNRGAGIHFYECNQIGYIASKCPSHDRSTTNQNQNFWLDKEPFKWV